MTSALLEHLAGNAIVGIIAFQVAVLLVVFSNAAVLVRPRRARTEVSKPLVSLLVPARNEAVNIEACVRSLLAQSYPNLEIVVLDDRSEDGTREVLERERERDDRLSLLAGEEPPVGWTGKNWACHQLSLAAKGEVLLFADADTVFVDPDTVLEIVAAMQAHRADLLSALPRQIVRTAGEALLVPLFYWALFSFTPLALSLVWRQAPFARVVGQVVVFRRAAYDEIGGHAAIKGSVVDDLDLAKLMARAGLATRIMDATTLVTCRMYRSGREAANGFAKNLFAAFGYAIIPYVFVWGWLGYMFLEPIVVWLLHVAFPHRVPIEPWLLVATIALSLIHWLFIYSHLRLPKWPALLYPLTMTVFLWLAVRSFVDSALKRTTWKNRHIARPPLRWF